MKIRQDFIQNTLDFLSQKGYETNHTIFLKSTAVFLAKLFDVNCVLIDKFSPKKPAVTETAVVYFKGNFLPNIIYELENTPCENVINNKVCSYSSNVKLLFPKDELLVQMDVDSYIGIPLWSSNKEPRGLIALMDDKPIIEEKNIETVLGIIAIKIEEVLEKMFFNNELNLKIKALKIAKKVAQENEEKFKKLSNLTFEGILIHEMGIVIDCNASFLKMFGYNRKDLVGKDITKIIYPEYYHKIISENRTNKKTHPYEAEGIRKDGSIFPIEVEARNIAPINNKTIRVTAFRDITGRKKAEAENKKLSIAIEQSANTVVITDIYGNIQYTNPKFTEVTGYTATEVLGKNPRILSSGIQTKEFYSLLWQTISAGNIWSGEFQNKAKNGNLYWELTTITPIKNEAGEICSYLAIKEDISKNKEAEENLKESEKKYRYLFENNPQPMWIYDIETLSFLEVNKAAIQHYGYTREEFLTMTLKDIRPKEDVDALLKDIEMAKRVGYNPASEWLHIKKSGEIINVNIVSHKVTLNNKEARHILVNDITATKKAEQALLKAKIEIEKSERKFRELFEKSGDAILIIKNGVFTECNKATLDMLGYKNYEDVLNLPPSKLSPEFQPDGLKSDEKANELINIALIKGTYRFEWWHTKSNGETFPVEVLLTTIENEPNNQVIHCIWRDITNRKQAEKQLQKQNDEYRLLSEDYLNQNSALRQLSNELSEKNKLLLETKQRFEILFEYSPVSLWEQDFSEVIKLLNGKKAEKVDLRTFFNENPNFIDQCLSKIKILNVNKITLELLGVKTINELKVLLAKTNNKKSIEAIKEELLSIASNNKIFTGETEFTSTSGKNISAIVTSAIIDDYGKAIASIIDISELKKSEIELKKAKEKAEESDHLKTEFIQNLSHEIRTPMNGILGFSELLDNPDLAYEKRKLFIDIIKNSTHQLLHIIDDIMEISVLETKQIKAEEHPVCLNELLHELFAVFNIKATHKNIVLVLKNGLTNQESTILTDKNKLNKVLSNLLENALKFTDEGFVELGYKINKESEPAELEIFVKDSGIGIKPEQQRLIFERFSQAEKALSKKVGGLGLGLSIAKENAELLGGKISVISELGKGAAFFVNIPYKPVNIVPSIVIEKVKIIEKNEKHTILIAEDEEVNFMVLEILLEEKLKLSCTIIHAKDGLEAVEVCKNHPAIELVLMDIKMPKMDGHEATRLIKKFRPHLPIIAQTAYSSPEEKEKALLAGCDDFLSKPINKDALSEVINTYLLSKKIKETN